MGDILINSASAKRISVIRRNSDFTTMPPHNDQATQNHKRSESFDATNDIPSNYNKDDPHLSWFYQPHSITILILSGIILVYVAFNSEHYGSSNPTLFGLAAMSLVFLVFSMVQMRDGLFRRPHAVFWRIVMGMAVLYLCLLVFLLFQTADFARQLLVHIDPTLGVQLPERSYADDCRIYTPENPESMFYNFKATLLDEFILAHFIGWWLKAMMFRDVYFCWATSILFEVLEVTFAHWLPNFKECWWDHVILDVLVCNAAGIYLGIKTCRYLEVKEYDWAGNPRPPKRKVMTALRNGVRQLSPQQFDPFHWDVLSSGKRFFAVCLLIVLIEIVELNAFFLKFVLWIPPPHYLNVLRLILWFFIGMPAIRESYQFATQSSCKRLGTMAWLASAILGTEVLISLKYGTGMFPNPWPTHIVLTWSVALALFGLWIIFYWGFWIWRKKKKIETKQE